MGAWRRECGMAPWRGAKAIVVPQCRGAVAASAWRRDAVVHGGEEWWRRGMRPRAMVPWHDVVALHGMVLCGRHRDAVATRWRGLVAWHGAVMPWRGVAWSWSWCCGAVRWCRGMVPWCRCAVVWWLRGVK